MKVLKWSDVDSINEKKKHSPIKEELDKLVLQIRELKKEKKRIEDRHKTDLVSFVKRIDDMKERKKYLKKKRKEEIANSK